MKKLSLIVCSLILLSFAGGVLSQTAELSNPGLAPDNPFYFIKSIAEGIGTFFTFNDLAKAERHTELATRRLAEAKLMTDKGKSEITKRVLERYQEQLEKALINTEESSAKGKNTERVAEIVAQATSKHLIVLEQVLEKVPEQAKPAIERAREVSVSGQIRALENLSQGKPERAAELNLQAIKNRLEKAEKERESLNEEMLEKTLADFGLLRFSLEKMAKENKEVLAELISENMIEQIEKLDELMNQSPFRIAEITKEVKEITINGQLRILKELASIDSEKASELNLKAVESHLNIIRNRIEEGRIDEAERAIRHFEKQNNLGEEISEIAQRAGKDITAIEQLRERATHAHMEALAKVYEKAPEEAKESIEKAMESSRKGYERAIDILIEKGAVEELFEKLPMPEEIPLQVKERIQERIKQQIRMEE